ncbi:hypothetical protein Tsubulata_047360, partial [Turnera subulata]
MLLRLSFLVVAAATAVSVSHRKQNSSIQRRVKDDSSLECIEEEETFPDSSSTEENQEEKDVTAKTELEKNMIQDKKLSYTSEVASLRSLATEFELRNANLERKLHELYGAKERQSYTIQLLRKLEEKKAEVDKLKTNINSLLAEKEDFQRERNEGVQAEKQLEGAIVVTKKMQKEMDLETKSMRSQLMMLQDQVFAFESEESCNKDIMTVDDRFEGVGLELHELRRKNKELELEKRELGVRLVATRVRIEHISNLTEGKIIAEVGSEFSSLKLTNEKLSEQVEELQRNRFDLVEELVYQRWLSACLRSEFLENQNPSRKSTTDNLSTSSNQKSLEKIKLLTLSSSFDSSSSHISSTESDKTDGSTTGSSSSSQRSSGKKLRYRLVQGIKKWGKSNAAAATEMTSRGNLPGRNGPVRRFSTSVISSKPSMQYNESDSVNSSPIKQNRKTDSTKVLPSTDSPRFRRVSFSDSVSTAASTHQDIPKLSGVLHDREVTTENTSPSSTWKPSLKFEVEIAKETQEL